MDLVLFGWVCMVGGKKSCVCCVFYMSRNCCYTFIFVAGILCCVMFFLLAIMVQNNWQMYLISRPKMDPLLMSLLEQAS
jgi:hypothetical protein